MACTIDCLPINVNCPSFSKEVGLNQYVSVSASNVNIPEKLMT